MPNRFGGKLKPLGPPRIVKGDLVTFLPLGFGDIDSETKRHRRRKNQELNEDLAGIWQHKEYTLTRVNEYHQVEITKTDGSLIDPSLGGLWVSRSAAIEAIDLICS